MLQEQRENDPIIVEILALDYCECTPCRGSLTAVQEAVRRARELLRDSGLALELRETNISSLAQAAARRFVSSPTIRVNGRDIAPELREADCKDCGDLCGPGCSIRCRVWTYRGQEYNAAPVGLVLDAILAARYASRRESAAENFGGVPENLRRFFAARSGGVCCTAPAAAAECCTPAEQSVCCEQQAKAVCC